MLAWVRYGDAIDTMPLSPWTKGCGTKSCCPFGAKRMARGNIFGSVGDGNPVAWGLEPTGLNRKDNISRFLLLTIILHLLICLTLYLFEIIKINFLHIIIGIAFSKQLMGKFKLISGREETWYTHVIPTSINWFI